MRGLAPRIHQKEQQLFKVTDCLVMPGNDEFVSI